MYKDIRHLTIVMLCECLFGAQHLMGLHPLIKLLICKVAQLDSHSFERRALLVGSLGDGGSFVVTWNTEQSGIQAGRKERDTDTEYSYWGLVCICKSDEDHR